MDMLVAATNANEGGGVNLLPIALVVILVIVGLVVWRRRNNR